MNRQLERMACDERIRRFLTIPGEECEHLFVGFEKKTVDTRLRNFMDLLKQMPARDRAALEMVLLEELSNLLLFYIHLACNSVIDPYDRQRNSPDANVRIQTKKAISDLYEESVEVRP